MNNILGSYVCARREKLGLTKRELAEICGLSHPAISMVESGKRKKPRPETLRKLAKGLRVPYELLLRKAGYLDVENSTSSTSVEKESLDLHWILGNMDLRFEGKLLNREQRDYLEIFLRTLLKKDERDKTKTK